ncbi:MAG: bifunctional oligoribonuclease/PAP phosphatase NrnA [Elusimicrobiaceae bacterium]|nr:bifunctional oligoribonuclease/PAP phosphatase NrnA [Elusimicrobiaceae bacterium]
MTRLVQFKKLKEAIQKGKYFFVAGHQNCDGDSLGCTLAVTSLLKRLGKKVYAYSKDRPGEDLLFLPNLDTVHFGEMPKNQKIDTMFLLECSDKKRGGDFDELFKSCKHILNVDHHITGEKYGTVNYIEPHASSTAEIIVQLFEFLKVKPTPKEATYLYTGLVTDTARFLHSNTTAEALRCSAYMLECGADIHTINEVLYNTKSYKEVKLLGRALEKLVLHHDKKTAEITLKNPDFKSFKIDPRYTQGIVSRPVKIPSVEVSVLLREEPDRVAVNLRSKGNVDVSAIAYKFGGGGHARAAGFKLLGAKIETVKKDLLKEIKKAVSKLK